MDLNLDISDIQYSSKSQQIRVLTESWVERNMFCPICGKPELLRFENNRPVADFYCGNCKEQYELKSKKGNLGNRIVDGAYSTMIERITSSTNPNFLFLTYNDYVVENLILIPNHFFTPNIIEKRKPLSDNARRAGWVGCNIDISQIPKSGLIHIIKNGGELNKDDIRNRYDKTKFIISSNLENRGWIMDILFCIDRIRKDEFTLAEIYAFENELKVKHPNNNFIKDKIRQQLQYLRDKGFIEFLSRGRYRKL